MMLGQKFALSRVSLYRVESVLQENTHDVAFHCRRTIPSVSSGNGERPNFGRTGTTGRRCSRSTGACRVQPAGENVSGSRLHERQRPWRVPALWNLAGQLLSACRQFSGSSRTARAAEWAFDSHLCVELLSRRDGRQPGGADRSEEWIRSRRRHESAAGEYLSRPRTRYRFENRPSSAQSGHISELSQSHGRRRRLQLRTELQSSDRNL